MVFYICDRKKCKRCSDECLYTSSYEHAASKTIIPKDLSLTFRHDENGNLWEKEPSVKNIEQIGGINGRKI